MYSTESLEENQNTKDLRPELHFIRSKSNSVLSLDPEMQATSNFNISM